MSEQDLEIQRLREQNAKLATMNKTLLAEQARLQAQAEEMQAAINNLQSMMAWFRKKLFGSMSEKHLPLDPNVLEPTLFDQHLSEEEQAKLDAEVKAMEEENAKVIEVKAHRREIRKPILSGDLPIEETHIYPEGVQGNPDYVEIGVENTDTLAIRPAKMYVRRVVRHKFVLKSRLQMEDPDRRTFLIAPLPETIRPKSMADASLLADILINKYIYHLPFYRQIQKHRAVKGYMWAVRDALTGDVYFHYDMGSRSGDTARKLIGGYHGAVQTDGYEVYESFENMPGKRMIGCWAHVRRKFVEALDENKKYASEAIVYIGKLYKIEEEMRDADLTPEEIKERRQKESYPVIQEFEKWMDSVSNAFTPKSRMGRAIVYTYTLLPRLSRYVLDGRYNIDNNGIENAIRPLALGRKNFLFAGNHDAAVRTAIVYSLFSSAKQPALIPDPGWRMS